MLLYVIILFPTADQKENTKHYEISVRAFDYML